jgi:hypothetical protein
VRKKANKKVEVLGCKRCHATVDPEGDDSDYYQGKNGERLWFCDMTCWRKFWASKEGQDVASADGS